MKITVVYVAGALRGNFINKWINFRKAKKVVKCLWLNKVAVYSPHLNSGWIDGKETDKFILPANIDILQRCDALLVLDNWKDSKGTIAEMKSALTNEIPIYFDVNHLIYDIKKGKLMTYDGMMEKIINEGIFE